MIDLVLASLILVSASIWGTRFWNTWIARGNQPAFYQSYFEPAVMIACGHGFVVSWPEQPTPLREFLRLQRDGFSCDEIPGTQTLGQQGLFQGPWRYLMYLVGAAWRLLGISWSGLGPMFGVLFGVSVAFVYALCRLGMGRVLAVAAASAVAISTVHLRNLPHLRDYAKEPFALALFFILGLIVSRPARAAWTVALAALYGAVLGVAYGFRTDFLINIPLLFLTLALFIEGGLLKNLRVKATAAAAALAAFLLVGWPIISSVYRGGGCQWHVVLLGLQSPFDATLAVEPAPYDYGYAYADGYVDETISAFTTRVSPQHPPMRFCSHEYDVQSGRYLTSLAALVPGDFVTRAFGSMRIIAELPFLWRDAPMPNWLTGLYDQRKAWLAPMLLLGKWFVAAAVLMIAAQNPRLACFVVFFCFYVGGYPALQFHDRHYFHLEFITWWALGFIVHQAVSALWRLARTRRIEARAALVGAGRVAVVGVSVWIAITIPLRILRSYQTARLSDLLSSYVASPKTALAQAGDGTSAIDVPVVKARTADLIEVDLAQQRCALSTQVTFRYDPAVPALDFTRTVSLEPSSAPGVTRVFMAVFPHFRSIEVPGAAEGCVAGVYRVADAGRYPVLIDAALPPGWEHLPLYQRLADWRPR